MFDAFTIKRLVNEFIQWVDHNFLLPAVFVQLAITASLFLGAWLLNKAYQPPIDRYLKQKFHRLGARQLSITIFPLIWFLLQGIATLVAIALLLPHEIMVVVLKLLTAWLVIGFSSYFIRSDTWSKHFTVIVWGIAALSILGLLKSILHFLDNIVLHIGSLEISVLDISAGIFTIIVLLTLAIICARVMEKYVNNLPDVNPSIQVLINKITKVILIVLAIFIGLDTVGVDLTALTVLGGAIGLGLGFGLQKVVSNLISGLILLMDKSIKPGDVIEVGNTYGWVNSLNARHVSVLTRDGVEYLIPNEHLITEKVTNWSYSNKKVRIRIIIGISYNSDVEKAMALTTQAAQQNKRVLKIPGPICQIHEFGDNSVNLELRLWIEDPSGGIANIRGEILLKVWHYFQEEGIEIPFPQRDVHLKSTEALKELVQELVSRHTSDS